MSDAPSGNLGSKATRALGWNYFAFIIGKVLVFVTIAILARVLTPEEIGIVALAMVAINYFTVIQNLGLGAAVIQYPGDIEDIADTVFTVNLLFGCLASIALFFLAPVVAGYFNEPLITPILQWLGLTFIFDSLGRIHTILLQRELDFRKKMIPDLAQSLVKGISSIGLALTGFGLWSLVIGQLLGFVAFVIFAWWVVQWLPRLTIDIKVLKPILRYGISVLAGDTLSASIDNLDYFIIGRVFGNAVLGIYSYAYRLPALLVINNLWVISGVIFPVYATVQTDMSRLSHAFRSTVRYLEIIVLPICLGLIIAADPIVKVVLGNQWLEVIPIIRVLSVYTFLLSVGYHAGGIYKAIGRPDISVKLSILTFVILIPCLLIGAQFGLIGVAFGHVVAVTLRTTIRLLVVNRYVPVSIWDIISEIQPAFYGGIALVSLALPVLYITQNLPSLVQLILVALAGAFGYLAVLWYIERNLFEMVLGKIGIRKFKNKPSITL